MISFDVLLLKLGSFGLSQIILSLMLSYFSMIGGFNALAAVFIAYNPDSRCSFPVWENKTIFPNLPEDALLNLTTPRDQGTGDYLTCLRYDFNSTACTGNTDCVNRSAPVIPCDKGYYYDTSLFTETVITEFNLICDRNYLNPLSSAMYYVGMLIGSILFGNAADRFGRRPTMIACTIGCLGSMFGVTFSVSVEMYIVFRACVAAFAYGVTITTFVYIMEIIGREWRTLTGIGYQILFAIGYMIMGGLAYQWRNWHDIMLAVTILSCPFLIITIIVPESPRWLFTSNKDKEGMKVTKRMAKLNKVKLTDDVWEEARKAGEVEQNEIPMEDERKYSIIDLYRGSGIRIISLKVLFNWFVNSLVYYGVSLNAGSLAGDIFVNNTLNGVFEIASYVACILLMDRTGRRILLAAMLLLSGLGLIASVIVNEYADNNQSLITLGVVFAFAGKFGISGSFAIIYNLTSELYPTVVRSNSIGNGSLFARIGGILAPFIISLQDYVSWLPNSLFGALAIVAGVLSLTFPETNGQPMLETLEQAEIFYKTGKIELNEKEAELQTEKFKESELPVGKDQSNLAYEADDDEKTIGQRF